MFNSTPLGEIALIKQGRYLAAADLNETKTEQSPIPVWGANGLLGYTANSTYESPQPLVTCRGNGCGLVQWTGGPANISNNSMAIVLQDAETYASRYLYYCLLSTDFSDVTTGSAQPQITVTHLKNKQIFWTDNPLDQKAIAHILGTLDNKIELNRKTSETLEGIAKAFFKSWFLDFDPVRAKAEGRPTGLSKEISDLFPDSFEDSELGEIPKGWKVMNISEVSEVVDCLHSKKPNLLDEGFNFLELKNIRDDFLLDTLNVSKISESDYQKWISRIEVCSGDLIITNVGRVGAVARVPDNFFGSIGRNITAIRPKEKSKNSFFLASYFSSTLFKSEKRLNVDTGTILDALNVKDIPKLRFFYPSSEILSNFEEQVSRIWQRREMILEENNNLSKLRDTLLPKLISGELKISDAENLVEETST